jgi:hypothetical protein
MAGLISNAMSIPLMSIVGWSLVPDFATKHVLSFFHRYFHGRSPPPPQGTRSYHQHYALTFALVVLGYLSYNLVSSAREMPSNFYEILGVPPTVDENGLKLAFRQFVKRNHPDRPDVGKEGEELFMMVRDVYEALKDPVVRFAYDRYASCPCLPLIDNSMIWLSVDSDQTSCDGANVPQRAIIFRLD